MRARMFRTTRSRWRTCVCAVFSVVSMSISALLQSVWAMDSSFGLRLFMAIGSSAYFGSGQVNGALLPDHFPQPSIGPLIREGQ